MSILRVPLALLVVILMLAAAPALAQLDRADAESAWIVRGGLFFPQGDTLDNSEWTVGLEYVFPAGRTDGRGNFMSLSADFVRISTPTAVGEDDVTLIPVLVNWKTRAGGTLRDRSPWTVGVGAGIYWAADPIPAMDIDDDIQFAWQVTAAYDFNPSLFVEARYVAGSNPSNDGLIGAQLGFRF